LDFNKFCPKKTFPEWQSLENIVRIHSIDESKMLKSFPFADSQALNKTYYVSENFKASWINSHAICKSFGMEFASLDSLDEQNEFFRQCSENKHLFPELGTFIGGYAKQPGTTDGWCWINSGETVGRTLPFEGRPDNADNNEQCLVEFLKNRVFKKPLFAVPENWKTAVFAVFAVLPIKFFRTLISGTFNEFRCINTCSWFLLLHIASPMPFEDSNI